MKRKIIALIFILVFLTFFSLELKAQSDAFFAIKKEQRTGGSNGLMFFLQLKKNKERVDQMA